MLPQIECQSVCKRFGSIKALDNFTLSISVKQPTGLVGANGAGKSTLFSILSGFIRPTSGTVKVFGESTDAVGSKGKLSILPQDTSMYRGISVFAQLRHYARLLGFSRQAAIAETERALEQVQASTLARQYPETLSFGQRKRVMLAQALLGKPELILLDEPTSGLDPVATREVHKLLEQIGQQHSLLISSHNLAEIEDICHEIVIIKHGKLLTQSSISDLKQVGQCFRLRLEQRSSLDVASVLGAIPGVSNVTCDSNDGRLFQVDYQEMNDHDMQIAILSALQKHDLGVSDLSKGAALADEIAALLQSGN